MGQATRTTKFPLDLSQQHQQKKGEPGLSGARNHR